VLSDWVDVDSNPSSGASLFAGLAELQIGALSGEGSLLGQSHLFRLIDWLNDYIWSGACNLSTRPPFRGGGEVVSSTKGDKVTIETSE